MMLKLFYFLSKQAKFSREMARAISKLKNVSGEESGNPLQYSCLENPMDGGAWQATVHGVAKSWTQLSN